MSDDDMLLEYSDAEGPTGFCECESPKPRDDYPDICDTCKMAIWTEKELNGVF